MIMIFGYLQVFIKAILWFLMNSQLSNQTNLQVFYEYLNLIIHLEYLLSYSEINHLSDWSHISIHFRVTSPNDKCSYTIIYFFCLRSDAWNIIQQILNHLYYLF